MGLVSILRRKYKERLQKRSRTYERPPETPNTSNPSFLFTAEQAMRFLEKTGKIDDPNKPSFLNKGIEPYYVDHKIPIPKPPNFSELYTGLICEETNDSQKIKPFNYEDVGEYDDYMFDLNESKIPENITIDNSYTIDYIENVTLQLQGNDEKVLRINKLREISQ